MNTIWIICGSLLIGTAIGNRITTSTIPTTSASDLQSSSSTIESTSKSRRSLQSFDHYDFTPTSRLVQSTSSFSPRISIVDSASNNPYKYSDTSFTNNFPIHHVDHPKLSTIQPALTGYAPHFDAPSGFKLIPDGTKLSSTNSFHKSSAANYYPTLSPMNIRHLVTLGTINSGNTHPIYPNKFEDAKFPRLSTRPLSSNIASQMTRSPINYSPAYPDIKSIKHNPTFVSPSLTNTGNFVPINLEQLQTSHGIPERIRASDVESKPNYLTNFNKPSSYLTSTDNFQANPVNLPASPYLFSNVSAAENYQLFSAQPQLHFYANSQQPIYQSQPFERIRTDVEVINKKRPTIPAPNNDDDSGYNDSNEDENIGAGQRDTSTIQQTNYQVPDSPVFNSYDAAFGKYSKSSPDLPQKEKLVEKPERYNSHVDKEEKHVYELQSDGETPSGSRENYEYGSGGESSPRERLQRDFNDDGGYNEEFAHFDSYGNDFNHDFEKSYQHEVPTEEFSHVKEVPDIDESVNKEKIISHEENKRGSRHTEITSPPRREYGYRIPKKNRSRTESTEQSTDNPNNKHTKSERNTGRTLKTSQSSNPNRKTSFNAPINEMKSLRHRELTPYVHQGGIRVINPPVLPTLPPI